MVRSMDAKQTGSCTKRGKEAVAQVSWFWSDAATVRMLTKPVAASALDPNSPK